MRTRSWTAQIQAAADQDTAELVPDRDVVLGCGGRRRQQRERDQRRQRTLIRQLEQLTGQKVALQPAA